MSLPALLLLAVGVTGLGFGAAACTPGEPLFNDASLVEVLRDGAVESLGTIVGDGSQVLTVVNYEDHSPGDLVVVSRDGALYPATTQALDPRTGATLLSLGEKRLVVVSETGDATALKPGHPVLVWGRPPTGAPPGSSATTVAEFPFISPLVFYVQTGTQSGPSSGNGMQGAPVTDRKGRVLGIHGVHAYRLAVTPPTMASVRTVVRIDSALELLSDDAGQRPWADGPILFTLDVSGRGRTSNSYGVTPADYERLALAVRDALGRLGAPLPADDVTDVLAYFSTSWPPHDDQDGSLLAAVYPAGIRLSSADGRRLGVAKWVGIQYDRSSGKPDRAIYGSTPYAVAGAFAIAGDLSALKDAARFIEPPGRR